ncbi:MAG: hypothetical protein IPH94_18020 [Saprospiraceae bacterium]|nr:hypothetical protein [Saprospiraceae bacterium]
MVAILHVFDWLNNNYNARLTAGAQIEGFAYSQLILSSYFEKHLATGRAKQLLATLFY